MSACETAKVTYIGTTTVLSASIHSDEQACLFPHTLHLIHFFSRCVLSNYEVFYFRHSFKSIRETEYSSIVCVCVLLLGCKQ